MKLQEYNNKFSVFIPPAIIHAMDWKKGDELEVKLLGKDRIEIRKK